MTSIVAALIASVALASCGWKDVPDESDGSGSTVAGVPPSGLAGTDAALPALANNISTDGRVWINYRRNQIGLSTLSQNTLIDTAAQLHTDYQRINGVTHEQEAGKQGFTGVTLENRMVAAGYRFTTSNAIGEVIAASTGQTGFYMVEDLITAIYHRFVIFEPQFKEIGTGSATQASSNYNYLTADLAANDGLGTGLAAGTIAVWPFPDQIQVQRNFFSNTETPDPVPDADEVGYPISVHANMSSTLVVQRFTVRARNATADLGVTPVITNADPANNHALTAAAIIPLSPLAAATTYDVSFTGTLNGQPVTRNWSFTTR